MMMNDSDGKRYKTKVFFIIPMANIIKTTFLVLSLLRGHDQRRVSVVVRSVDIGVAVEE